MAAIFLRLLRALISTSRRWSDLILENIGSIAPRRRLAVFKHGRPRLRLTHPDRIFSVPVSRRWSRWWEVLLVVSLKHAQLSLVVSDGTDRKDLFCGFDISHG